MSFFTPTLAEALHWSISDSNSPQVSRTLLSILADLNNAVVWIVLACPSIFDSFYFTNLLEIAPSAPFTSGITVSFTFHSFFSSLTTCIFFVLFDFHLAIQRNGKVSYSAGYYHNYYSALADGFSLESK